MSRLFAIGFLVALSIGGFARPGAAAEKVALLPVPVIKGNQLNGSLLFAAMRSQLARRGHQLIQTSTVQKEMKRLGLDPAKPLPEAGLTRLGQALKVDTVFYLRVLNVGQQLGETDPTRYRAVCFINVLDVRKGKFFHTYQISQVFKPAQAAKEDAAMSAQDARQAAKRLMATFKSPPK